MVTGRAIQLLLLRGITLQVRPRQGSHRPTPYARCRKAILPYLPVAVQLPGRCYNPTGTNNFARTASHGLWATVFCGFCADFSGCSGGSRPGRRRPRGIDDRRRAADGGRFPRLDGRFGPRGDRQRPLPHAAPADQVGIDVQGSPERPLYLVTGMLSSRGELVLPGGHFGRGDAGQVGQWLKDLAANGPPERRERKSAFGLTAAQLQGVHDDLAQLVGFSTQGVCAAKSWIASAVGCDSPSTSTAGSKRPSAGTGRGTLSALSCGTALACVLRPAGLCLIPRCNGPARSDPITDAAGLSDF